MRCVFKNTILKARNHSIIKPLTAFLKNEFSLIAF